jgi:penicillin-binding protein 1A
MKLALKDKPATPFRVPRAIELMPIDAKNGKRGIFGQPGVILEAFKPGDEPPDSTKVIGEGAIAAGGAADGGVMLVPPSQDGSAAPAPAQPVPQAPADGGLTGQGGGLY